MFGISGATDTRLATATLSGRLDLWHIALIHIRSAPWLGIGPMQYAAIDTGSAAHPHNAILLWAVEWGIPAALIITIGIGWLYYRWLVFARARTQPYPDTAQAPLIVAITAALIAGGVHAMVSGITVMPVSQLLLVTVVALAGGIASRGQPSISRTTIYPFKNIAKPTISLCTLFAAIYVGLFTGHDYFERVKNTARIDPATTTYTRNSFAPRYWQDGTLTNLTSAPLSAEPTQ